MGQIVRRRKKGRSSKSDLGRRGRDPDDDVPRRSLRRRSNVRYTFDFDDYLDDDEFSDDDEERREKKLKLLLKLRSDERCDSDGDGGETESTRRVERVPSRRSGHAPSESDASRSSDDDDEGKPTKKRKIKSVEEDEEDEDMNLAEVRGRKVEAEGDDDDGGDSVPGTPTEHPTSLPLPDKKTLELILDKLQKKDIYGVYAEPVDPQELPDYHDVIKHPMDFATVRRKLANGTYSTLEQLESDVLLICANAMQYNAPDTIYYKQASSIKELAQRKFHRLRVKERSETEMKSEQETTSSLLPPTKQARKPVDQTLQDPIGSDFSSGATLATAGESKNGSRAAHAANFETPSSVDVPVAENASAVENNLDKEEESLPGKCVLPRPVRKLSVPDENRRATYHLSNEPEAPAESIYSTFESEIKQLVPVGLHEDHSYARSLARFAAPLGSVAWKVASRRIEQALPDGYKFGRGWVGEYEPVSTPVLLLENCPLKEPDFHKKCTGDAREDEKGSKFPVSVKEINKTVCNIPVPAKDTHGKLITNKEMHEKASKIPISMKEMHEKPSKVPVPVPVKEIHDRGSTPVGKLPLFGNTIAQFPTKEESLRGYRIPVSGKEIHEKASTVPDSAKEIHDRGSSSVGKLPLFSNTTAQFSTKKESPRGSNIDAGSLFFRSLGVGHTEFVTPKYQQQNSPSSILVKPEIRASSPVELNRPPPANETKTCFSGQRQIPNGFDQLASMSAETVSKNINNFSSAAFKHPMDDGFIGRELTNGKAALGNIDSSNRMFLSSSNNIPNRMNQAGTALPHRQEQGLSDPVQLMKMYAEKAQHQHHKSSSNSPVDVPEAASPRLEDSNHAASDASRAWMSLGSGGFKVPSENATSQKHQLSSETYNPVRNQQPQVSRFFQPDKNSYPVHAFVPQPVGINNGSQFQVSPVGMGFPQFANTAGFSRFQVQPPPWRGVNPHIQQRQRQDPLPPDLNIGYQSAGSPVRQSPGVHVDSQQPDLALQL